MIPKYPLRVLLFLVLLFCLPVLSFPQVNPPVEPPQEGQLEQVAESAGEDTDLEEIEESRLEALRHPVVLNQESNEELIRLGILNELQVMALIQHIHHYGSLIALEELQTIRGFDILTIRQLLPYVSLEQQSQPLPTGFQNLLTDGSHQIVLRGSRVLERQKGYKPKEDSEDTRYIGDAWKLYTRYLYNFGNSLAFGITAEKDPGEAFFKEPSHSGFDFYSGHLIWKPGKLVTQVIVGDYQAFFGQGLVLWSGLAIGKSPDVMTVKRNAKGLRPYRSVNEFSFLRGGAVSLGKGKWSADFFGSIRNMDATTDSSEVSGEDLLVSSFTMDGYHRTPSEIERKKNPVDMTMAGGHAGYKSLKLEAGLTIVHNRFGYAIQSKSEPYQRYDFSGPYFTTGGADFSLRIRNALFFGEAAASDDRNPAFLAGTLISLDPRLSLSVAYRYYSKGYDAFFNNPFRESDFSNEQGYYTGLNWQLSRTFTWSSYVDVFRFPWLRYQVDAPATGYETLHMITWTPARKVQVYLRYRDTRKQENLPDADGGIDEIAAVQRKNYRLHTSYKVSPAISLQGRYEWVNLLREDKTRENGSLIYQDINIKPLGKPFTLTLRYVIFRTGSYDTRVYTYENEIPGVYSIPAYYYSGQRCYFLVRYRIIKGVDAWFRYGYTVYPGMKSLGSGLEEITGNHKSDFKLQLRFQF